MANPDLRMVVLAISPTYAHILQSAVEDASLLEEHRQCRPEIIEALDSITREIIDQLGSMPTAEEFHKQATTDGLPAESGTAWVAGNKAAAVAAKMAKAALEAAEGTTENEKGGDA